MAPYTDVDPTVFMQRYEEAMTRRTGGYEYWSPKQGAVGRPIRSVVRVLPPHPNMRTDVFVGMKVHFSLGPNMDTASPCLEPYAEPCPACEWVDHLFAQAKREPDADRAQQYRDMAFKQRAGLRFFANIIDMAKPEAGVQTWGFGPELEKRVRACFLDDQQPPQFRNIAHPETGRDVIIEVSTKPNTDFRQYDVIRAKETAAPLPDMDWLNHIRDLTEEVYKPSREQVQNALYGKKIDRRGGGSSGGGAPALASGPAPVRTPVAVTAAPAPAPVPAAVPSAPTAGLGLGSTSFPPPSSPQAPGFHPPAAYAAPPPPPPPAQGYAPMQPPPPPPPPPQAVDYPPVAAPPPPPPPPSAPVAAAGRGRRAVSAVPSAPLPPETPAAPPAAMPEAPARRAVVVAGAPDLNGTLAAARARVLELGAAVGFTSPRELPPGELQRLGKPGSTIELPSCYGRSTDPADSTCQKCPAIVPCMAIKMGLMAA